jgi:excisionase family DNA binding protein
VLLRRTNKNAPIKRTTLTVGEFSQVSGLSVSTIRRACKAGELRHTRIGKIFLISADELDRRLADHDQLEVAE